jgi:hypothetical protein
MAKKFVGGYKIVVTTMPTISLPCESEAIMSRAHTKVYNILA